MTQVQPLQSLRQQRSPGPRCTTDTTAGGPAPTGEEETHARPEGPDSPQLALDLHPAGAAQERPGMEPLLHGLQARAQHLQPQM